jgi:hypothetical protein
VLLGLLLAEVFCLAVIAGRIGAMADLGLLILVVLPVPSIVLFLVLAASESRLVHAEETEHRGSRAARDETERLAAGPGFTRDRLCQLIEPSVIHSSTFLLAV